MWGVIDELDVLDAVGVVFDKGCLVLINRYIVRKNNITDEASRVYLLLMIRLPDQHSYDDCLHCDGDFVFFLYV